MHLLPDRDGLSTRLLAVFLVLGLLLIVSGFSVGGLFYILVGAVLVAVNGQILAKRILHRNS